MKLWLLFANAEDLEFITAAATAVDVSNPYVLGFLAGEDERLAAG
jgi:deoxyinosine 3'endonuclease (endonuclease V)